MFDMCAYAEGVLCICAYRVDRHVRNVLTGHADLSRHVYDMFHAYPQ